MQLILGSGDIKIRLMEDTEVDYGLMAKWLSDPRVYEFVHGKPKDINHVKKHYGPRILKKENIYSCFIEYKNKPIGYIQYFNIKKYEKKYELTNTKDVWAIDMWIGEPEYWGHGIGSKTLELLSNFILKVYKAKNIVIDPHTDNPRAIRAYEKAGFKKVKILKKHEMHKNKKVDCWLMEKPLDNY